MTVAVAVAGQLALAQGVHPPLRSAHAAVPVPHWQHWHAIAALVHCQVAAIAHDNVIALVAIPAAAHLAVVSGRRKVSKVGGALCSSCCSCSCSCNCCLLLGLPHCAGGRGLQLGVH